MLHSSDSSSNRPVNPGSRSHPGSPAAASGVVRSAGVGGAGAWSAATAAIHGASRVGARSGVDASARSLVPPLVQSTTYLQPEFGGDVEHAYSRVSNPTVDVLERELGVLEDAPAAVCFSTGLAAETALFLSLLKSGDHAVLGKAIYGGTVRLFSRVLNELGIEADFVDSSEPAEVRRAIRRQTRLVFIETPANPTLELTDISAIAAVSREAGVPLIVDNTFLTAAILRPLDLGADVSLYSTTKHTEGHSTALGGAVVTRDENLLERLRFTRKCTGSIQTPFNAWLTSRGLKTLPLRIRQHSIHAQRVAEWLEACPGVARVNYPGLAGFPQRELAARQHGGWHGGVVSFELEGGFDAAVRFLNSVRLCSLVEHVGSVETLVTHPASMTHGDVPREQRLSAGIADGLIRLSVGLEDPADVIGDLDGAIRAATEEDFEAVTARSHAIGVREVVS